MSQSNDTRTADPRPTDSRGRELNIGVRVWYGCWEDYRPEPGHPSSYIATVREVDTDCDGQSLTLQFDNGDIEQNLGRYASSPGFGDPVFTYDDLTRTY